jgi:hypothetical protein
MSETHKEKERTKFGTRVRSMAIDMPLFFVLLGLMVYSAGARWSYWEGAASALWAISVIGLAIKWRVVGEMFDARERFGNALMRGAEEFDRMTKHAEWMSTNSRTSVSWNAEEHRAEVALRCIDGQMLAFYIVAVERNVHEEWGAEILTEGNMQTIRGRVYQLPEVEALRSNKSKWLRLRQVSTMTQGIQVALEHLRERLPEIYEGKMGALVNSGAGDE